MSGYSHCMQPYCMHTLQCHCGMSDKPPPACSKKKLPSKKPTKVLSDREKSVCPRCLEQVTGKRWFRERPEHDHLHPYSLVLFFKEDRPKEHATESTCVNLFERFCIWQRKMYMEHRYKKMIKVRHLDATDARRNGFLDREQNRQWRNRKYTFFLSSW